jgi:hypothetical protein
MQYVDWRLDFELYGSVYFCTHCAAEPCRALGWIDPERANALLDQNKTLSDSLESAIARLEELEHSLDVLATKRLANSERHVVNHLRDGNAAVESVQNQLRGSEGAVSKSGGTASKTVEPAVSQGPNDLGDDELNKLIGI